MASNTPIEGLVQAYVDGELTPSQRARFEQELHLSASLRRAVEQHREMTAMLFDAYGEDRLHDDLRDSIMAHLPEIDHERLVQEVNYRAKHPYGARAWTRFLIPALVPLVLFIVGVMLYASWPDYAVPTGQPIGLVSADEGRFRALDADGSSQRSLALNDKVYAGERYRTQENSQTLLMLQGGTSLKLAANTELTLYDDRQIEIHKGRVWLGVGKDGRLFQVKTPRAKATVFGTIFQVSVREENTLITLREGEVTVQNKVSFWELKPDQQVSLSEENEPLVPRQVNARMLMTWADAIVPDQNAEQLVPIQTIAQEKIISHAQPVWRCDTNNRPEPTAITFRWQADQQHAAHCGYEVYVYDEFMQPLFLLDAIPGSVFGAAAELDEPQSWSITIPQEQTLVNRIVNIRLVPDYSSGYTETTFTEVTAVSS